MVAAGQVGRRSKREMLFSSLWEGADSVLCLALGRFFSSKGCQNSTLIKGWVAESAKTLRFWPRKRMDCGSLLRTL